MDELYSDCQIEFVERDLPLAIDLLIDERNGISLPTQTLFQGTYVAVPSTPVPSIQILSIVFVDEQQMKSYVISLAQVQVQFERIWVVLQGTNCIARHETMTPTFTATYCTVDDFEKHPVFHNLLHSFYAAFVNFRIQVTMLTR